MTNTDEMFYNEIFAKYSIEIKKEKMMFSKGLIHASIIFALFSCTVYAVDPEKKSNEGHPTKKYKVVGRVPTGTIIVEDTSKDTPRLCYARSGKVADALAAAELQQDERDQFAEFKLALNSIKKPCRQKHFLEATLRSAARTPKRNMFIAWFAFTQLEQDKEDNDGDDNVEVASYISNRLSKSAPSSPYNSRKSDPLLREAKAIELRASRHSNF